MSWFKKRSDSKNSRTSSDASSLNSGDCQVERRSRCDTDPDTCLEVFRNHWEQAHKIIKKDAAGSVGVSLTVDEIDAVRQNFEQMVTLLADEEGENGQGMPGPILHYLLEHDILDKFCQWCHRNNDQSGKLVEEQLRMFEHLISQSHQLLLIHKPVIRPLLNLLNVCSDGDCTEDVEQGLVLVLHQLCVSISKEAVILESFFNMNADHGPTKFLIFSLLIPFLHREGKLGQQARDAFLLIMTLSSKHPYIGTYIAENSDFCPVLATGLSGLYSDLPRKIEAQYDDWYQLSDDYVQSVPEMIMFLNSLEFCNAVAQIAHPLVRDQLIKYIYNGFLVPVLGPALHQDIVGLPTPLLDSSMFANSREEVIAATAYLDLFLRKISEPSLIKAFLVFIFTEKNDEIVILESLITRLHSSTKLCLVSLSLFHTLIDLNCEDVMFELIFKHLVPCTHVMVSQRRSVRDQDIYCRSVEKFLSLRPTCCLPEIDSPKHGETKPELVTADGQNGTFGSKLEHFETSYLEYLHDAHLRQKRCAQACQVWVYPYDGENPGPTCFQDKTVSDFEVPQVSDRSGTDMNETGSGICRLSPRGNQRATAVDGDDTRLTGVIHADDNQTCDIHVNGPSAIVEIIDGVSSVASAGEVVRKAAPMTEKDFISLLEDSDSPTDKSVSVDDSLKCLENILSTMSLSMSRTSTPRKVTSKPDTDGGPEFPSEFGEGSEVELSTVYYDCESSRLDGETELFKSINNSSFDIINTQVKTKTTNATEFEIVNTCNEEILKENNNNPPSSGKSNVTSFVDITSPEQCPPKKAQGEVNDTDNEMNCDGDQISDKQTDGKLMQTEAVKTVAVKGDKSVRFAAPPECTAEIIPRPPSVSSMSSKQSATPSIGPFLTALLLKLEGMMQNSFTVNLMLTGLISRLAVYPQPLLRSFLLNHTLVFQPTVKSLVQVLTTVRQRVDHYSYSVQNFEALLLRARRTLAQREGLLPERSHSMSPSPEMVHTKLRAATISDLPSKEKRHRTLTELLFRRGPSARKSAGTANIKTKTKLEILAGNKGMRYVNRKPEPKRDGQVESVKTRNAVYCAIVLEEFVKELAALTQEHTVLFLEGE